MKIILRALLQVMSFVLALGLVVMGAIVWCVVRSICLLSKFKGVK